MINNHGWQQCRPVLLNIDAVNVTKEEAEDALQMAWSLVSGNDRLLFHAYCCLNVHNDETHAAIFRIGRFLKSVLEDE